MPSDSDVEYLYEQPSGYDKDTLKSSQGLADANIVEREATDSDKEALGDSVTNVIGIKKEGFALSPAEFAAIFS